MSLHPLQLPTGQGHLKIKSVLAWQPFLVEQSPSYHEVIRWLTPSHGRAWGLLEITRYQCSGGSEVALGQEKAVPGGGWRLGVPLSVYMAFPRCQLAIRSGPRSFQSWLGLQLRHRQGGGRQDLGTCFPGCAPVSPCSVGILSFACVGSPSAPAKNHSWRGLAAVHPPV